MRTILICSFAMLWALPAPAQKTGDDAAIDAVVQKYLNAREERIRRPLPRCSWRMPINWSLPASGGKAARRS